MPMTTAARIRAGWMLMLGLACAIGCEKDRAANVPPPQAQLAVAPATQPAGAANTATQPADAGEWRALFDGKSLKNWKVADYAGHGDVGVEDGLLILPSGEGLTGVTWTGGELPKTNYELEVVAKKIDGVDFFCGITFPVADSFASLITGGWGGAVVGISSIDGEDAANNETTVYEKFERGQFYKFRIRVEPKKIMAWIDDKEAVNVDIEGKKISIRGDIDQSTPLGLASWTTTGAVKSVKIRDLPKK